MKNKIKFRVTNDGVEGFFTRAREHARKLDRGEVLAPEVTVSFESTADLMRVLSPQRIGILKAAKKGAVSVSGLAGALRRDTRAVSRDVDLLEKMGLLRTRYHANPGHGRLRIVEPLAAQYQLIATL
jgi:predicted transcriptional regulator